MSYQIIDFNGSVVHEYLSITEGKNAFNIITGVLEDPDWMDEDGKTFDEYLNDFIPNFKTPVKLVRVIRNQEL